jgi:hypothetical protein
MMAWATMAVAAEESAAGASAPVPETELGKLAATLQPGEMKELMCDPVSGDYIVQGHRPRKYTEGFGKVVAFHPMKDELKGIPHRIST